MPGAGRLANSDERIPDEWARVMYSLRHVKFSDVIPRTCGPEDLGLQEFHAELQGTFLSSLLMEDRFCVA